MPPSTARIHADEVEPRLDPLTPKERSQRMQRVKSRDTKPELVVQRIVDGLGYPADLNASGLPGKPDLVFPALRKVIFVHGCYWHLHDPCGHYSLPRTRQEFWLAKLHANRDRDVRQVAALREMGWEVLVVWECELRDESAVTNGIRYFLAGDSA